MSSGLAQPAGAELVLDWPGGPVTITWSSAPGHGDQELIRGAAPTVAGEFLVADAHAADPGRLEVADVICCVAGHDECLPDAGLRQMLERYPGCAVVAASGGPDRCRVITRADGLFRVALYTDLTGAAAFRPMLCASFVYGWLASGRPVTMLEPARLVAVARRSAFRDQVPLAPYGISRFQNYDHYLSRPEAIEQASPSRRRRVAAASRAPVAE